MASDFLKGLMGGSSFGSSFGVPSSYADFTGVQLGPDPTVQAIQALLQGGGNDRQRQDKNRRNPSGGTDSNSRRIIVKPRPVPRGYKPPLDRWHGITMQPGAIASLQNAPGRMGEKIAGHAVSSYRPYAEQARIYASGVRPAAPPGSSYHQQGLAIDDPWIRQHHAVMAWLLHHGWENGANFGDPNHWTYKVDG